MHGSSNSTIVGSRRTKKQRAEQATESFFRSHERGAVFTDRDGTQFHTFQNRTDFTPDREHLPSNVSRRKPNLRAGLPQGVDPHTNAVPTPDHTINNQADHIRNRQRVTARRQVATVTNGLQNEARSNQSATGPVGFFGGYDTTLLDADVHLGTTSGLHVQQDAPRPATFVEPRSRRTAISTVNAHIQQNRADSIESDVSRLSLARGVDATYETADVDNRLTQPRAEHDVQNNWKTFSATLERDPTFTNLRLSSTYDVVDSSAAVSAQRPQDRLNNTTVMKNRVHSSISGLDHGGLNGTTAQQHSLTNSGPAIARTYADITHADSSLLGTAQQPQHRLVSDVSQVRLQAQRGTEHSTQVGQLSGQQLVGVNNTSDGDNISRQIHATDAAHNGGTSLSSRLSGLSQGPVLTARQRLIEDFDVSAGSVKPSNEQAFKYA
jgi:hypothetical protein